MILPGSAPGREPPLVLGVAGSRIEMTRSEALLLRDTAAAEAGRSSRARDLSLLLERSLTGSRVLALSRRELQTLIQLAKAAAREDLAMRLGSANR